MIAGLGTFDMHTGEFKTINLKDCHKWDFSFEDAVLVETPFFNDISTIFNNILTIFRDILMISQTIFNDSQKFLTISQEIFTISQ